MGGFMINWHSNSTEILLNPRYSDEEKSRYIKLLGSITGYPAHLWLATSGTSGSLKFVALSKQAILASASGVNSHLQSNASDVWVNPLPDFHVGGIGIWARSYLSGASVVDYKTNAAWDPIHFCDALHSCKVTLTALVPTQLYDLVINRLAPPESLRAVIVGGGVLDSTLYDHAKALGWPILPSYGLTECSSQVATATSDSKRLKVLPHVTIKIDDGHICIKSEALLSVYAMISDNGIKLVDPKVDGWFCTEDHGELQGSILSVLGRSSDFIKIGGESVDLNHLESILNKLKMRLEIAEDMLLITSPEPRLGKVIHLITTGKDPLVTENLVRKFNQEVLPFARIRQVQITEIIPRTPLGKPLRSSSR